MKRLPFSAARQRYVAMASLAVLAACGGGSPADAMLERAAEAARRPVAPAELPSLHRCLVDLSSALRASAAPQAVDLSCAAGTYRGLTTAGAPCHLRVDAGLRRFSFDDAERLVEIDLAPQAFLPDGRARYNLEPSPLNEQQPGVQLTRFTPLPEARTELIALRAGLPEPGPRGLPQLSYQQVQGGSVQEVRCRFGA